MGVLLRLAQDVLHEPERDGVLLLARQLHQVAVLLNRVLFGLEVLLEHRQQVASNLDGTHGGGRHTPKHIDAFGDIRLIQDFIVDQARRSSVPVVENTNIEAAVQTVIEFVYERAERMRPAAV